MKIKTKENFRTIKTVDKSFISKGRSGISGLDESAEETQNAGYESGTDYAGAKLQEKENRIGKNMAYGVSRIGNWGLNETRKNLRRYSRCRNFQTPGFRELKIPERKMLKSSKTAHKKAKTVKKASKSVHSTAKGIKAFARATMSAIKTAAVGVKALTAAIVAGGWVAVLIVVIICLVAAIAGSVCAVFIPVENQGISIYDAMSDLEREYKERQDELLELYPHDTVRYDGNMADWKDIIAVYAVKINLESENPQEIIIFDESKAEVLRTVFWDMNSVKATVEKETVEVTRHEIDENGNAFNVTEEITTVILRIISDNVSVDKIADKYGFDSEQKEILSDLLNDTELWENFYQNKILE